MECAKMVNAFDLFRDGYDWSEGAFGALGLMFALGWGVLAWRRPEVLRPAERRALPFVVLGLVMWLALSLVPGGLHFRQLEEIARVGDVKVTMGVIHDISVPPRAGLGDFESMRVGGDIFRAEDFKKVLGYVPPFSIRRLAGRLVRVASIHGVIVRLDVCEQAG
jgi:hypothetical protein